MDNKGHIPEYNITDDILNAVAGIAERLVLLPLPQAESKELETVEPYIYPAGFRQKGAGVFAGEHLLGRAPMPQYVWLLMKELEDWLEQSNVHPLLKAGVTLYQYVMVQFFEGDNICYGIKHAETLLCRWRPQLSGVELEDILSGDGFIRAFEQCDLYGDAGPFLLFFLKSIDTALEALPVDRRTERISSPPTKPAAASVKRLLDIMDNGEYTTRELMMMVGLKHRPTFRDKYLLPAMAAGEVEMTIPDKPNSSQQRYRRVL